MENFTLEGPLGPIECIVEKNRSEKEQVLIMAHGFRGSRESGGRALGIAQQCACCCSVVRFNFTGTQILSLQVKELQAVIKAVAERDPDCKIFLLGRSMGGAASLITASLEPAVAKLILWATPNNMRETFKHVMTEEYYNYVDAGNTLEFTDDRGPCSLTPDFLTDFDNYDLEAILAAWNREPILLLHCEGDTTVVVEQAKRNAAILGERGHLVLFPEGDHSFTDHSEKAGALIAAWLDK